MQEVKEGSIVTVEGREFVASDVMWFDELVCGALTGRRRVTFTGTCTDRDVNDGIRNTAYNGGQYGGNTLVYVEPMGWDKCRISFNVQRLPYSLEPLRDKLPIGWAVRGLRCSPTSCVVDFDVTVMPKEQDVRQVRALVDTLSTVR